MQIRAAFASTARSSPRQTPAAIKPSAKSKSHRRNVLPSFLIIYIYCSAKISFRTPSQRNKKFLRLLAGKSNFAKNYNNKYTCNEKKNEV